MNIISKRIASAVAAGALMLNAGLPIFADTTAITGNGAGSSSFVTNSETNTNTITQNNSATVDNTVTSNLNTGNNTAQFNTGGDVLIATGNAKSTVDVSNALNSNVADIACCSSNAVSSKIDGNGALSTNVVNTSVDNSKSLTQDNSADVRNAVDTTLNSGYNNAGLNTGGDVTVATGSTVANVGIATRANSNEAVIGGNGGSLGLPNYSAITGNGAGSDNFITNALNKSLSASQNNSAYVSNDVATDGNTGNNDATFNTGGDNVIHTGSSAASVVLDNMVNFNHLNTDCGCVTGFSSKISGNGAGLGLYPSRVSGLSDFLYPLGGGNTINNSTSDSHVYDQNGSSDLRNYTDFGLTTGTNDNSLSTAYNGVDPWIVTGNAQENVTAHNVGNLNVLGTGVGFTFDLSPLMGMLHSHL